MTTTAASTAAVTTTPLGARRTPLLTLLPAEGALAWVRRGEGLVGWGEADRLEVGGPSALRDAAEWWADRCARTAVSDPLGVPGSGPVVFGSVAFDPAAGTSVFVVPEVVVGRRGGATWVTVTGEDPDAVVETSEQHAATSIGRLAYADGALDPVAWCGAVAAAVARIEAGELDKVVLARDLLVSADRPLDPRRLLLRLAERFPDTWTFAVDGLLGATPELLLRRTGREIDSRVLAGTAPRGAGDEDDRLAAGLESSAKDHAEHAYAVDSLADALRPYVEELHVPERPDVLTLPNVRHLASDVHGRQRDGDPTGLLELVGAVHPTAAVCGSPTPAAARVIGELEGMDRGRYAGPVGWLDSRGDGEFGLALRCAQLTGADGGRQARLFAGCGIVAGSDPIAELAETQAKLAAFQAALED
ncbi:isochorismate synthase MenF [Modestobacter sp. SSW1-42]|uniref:isochorismate synthase n=1 Tax=Modestobacter sp. SSW1-42 TaxID=596372 RepID=UPI0039867979